MNGFGDHMNADKCPASLSKEPKWYYTLLYIIYFHCFIINIYYYLFYLPHDWVRIWEGNFRDGNGMPLYTNPQKIKFNSAIVGVLK